MYKLTAVRILCCFLVTILLVGMGFAALADGARPAGGGAVHWRLQSVETENTPFSANGYEGEAAYGLEETQAEDAQARAYLTLTLSKSGGVALEQRYNWDVLPEALEPNVEYLVNLSGSVSVANDSLSSTLSVVVASERVQRLKAGEEPVQAAFSVPKSLPETLDIQMVLRDGQEWGQASVTYHYIRYDGPVPVPTPEPIVFAAGTPEAAPDYYIPVPEVAGLYVVEGSEPLRYRIYGAFGSEDPAYYPADAEGTLTGEEPVDPASEEPVREPTFVLQEPDALPEPYQQIAEGLYGFEDADGRIQYRVYGAFPDTQAGFYRANAFGVVTDRAPVDPAEDLPETPEGFVPSVPKDTDAYPTQEGVSLWFFIDRDGTTHYRSYGSLNGGAEAFYPADADGNVALDALPVTPENDFVQYIQGFVSVSPSGQLPLFYEAVVGEDGQLFWRFEGRDGQMVYRVYGKLDGRAAAFYPADDQGKLLDGAVSVTPTEDYINHIRGFVAIAYTPTAYDFYESVEGSDGSLWRFMDAYDQWQYRRYGSLHRGLPAFYPSDEVGTVTDDAVPVARDRDRAMLPVFTQEAPAQVPVYYVEVEEGLWRVMLAEPYVYRIYGAWSYKPAAFYPADDQGELIEDSKPVDPQADFDAYVKGFKQATPPTELPFFYETVAENLWAVADRDGALQYRVYGYYDGVGPAFYGADEAGNALEGGAARTPDQDFEDYVKGFEPVAPDAQAVPYYYHPVQEGLWRVEDAQGNAYFRVYGIMDRQAQGFFPANESGVPEEGIGTVDPSADFEAYVKGFVPGQPPEVPSYYNATGEGLWVVKDANDNAYYRVYGSKDQQEPAYYESDETGAEPTGEAKVVDPATDFETYVEGFIATVPSETPSYYEPAGEGLWAVEDAEGNAHYRVYGSKDQQEPAFYESDESAGEPVGEATAVDPSADFEAYVKGFIPEEPSEMPSYYKPAGDGLWSVEDAEGNTYYRVYGSKDQQEPAFYESDESAGEPVGEATAVDPAADFEAYVKGFISAEPSEVPSYYNPAGDGLWSVEDAEGNTYYRVYGSKDQQEPAFYESDETGSEPVEETGVADPSADFEAYVKGFIPATPSEVPSYYKAVGEGLWVVEDAQGNAYYRVYGSKDQQEPAFYAADVRGAMEPESQAVDPEMDFEAYVKGFIAVEPGAAPAYYKKAADGLWFVEDADGNKYYRVYGSKDQQDPVFFEADAQGNLLEGTVSVDPEQDYINYVLGFIPKVPPEGMVPDFYQPVGSWDEGMVWQFEDVEGVVHRRVYGSMDSGEPAFYDLSSAKAVLPTEDQRLISASTTIGDGATQIALQASVDPTPIATAPQQAPTQAQATQNATPKATTVNTATTTPLATTGTTLPPQSTSTATGQTQDSTIAQNTATQTPVTTAVSAAATPTLAASTAPTTQTQAATATAMATPEPSPTAEASATPAVSTSPEATVSPMPESVTGMPWWVLWAVAGLAVVFGIVGVWTLMRRRKR